VIFLKTQREFPNMMVISLGVLPNYLLPWGNLGSRGKWGRMGDIRVQIIAFIGSG
jgi:hypothetical protein